MKNKYYLVVFLVFMVLFFQDTHADRAEAQRASTSAESEKSTDNCQSQIMQLRLGLRRSMLKVKDSELDEFKAKFDSEPYYHMKLAGGDRNKIIPVLLAGMKKRPEQPYWVGTLRMFSSSDLRTAKKLATDERKEHCRYTLAYLQETVDIIQTIPKTDPNQKDSSSGLAMLQSPMAMAAMEAGELSLSKQIAKEMLSNNNDPNSWNYGNVIHKANTTLGCVALRENDIEKAKYHLIESGRTPGSPQLNSFGPSFILARALLEKGEKDVVMEYLDLVAVFWANPDIKKPRFKHLAQEHAEQLFKWKREINEGKIPNDRKWR